ncbi:hypothetical protein ABLN72_01895 [Mycobacterium tuberculosis]
MAAIAVFQLRLMASTAPPALSTINIDYAQAAIDVKMESSTIQRLVR